jgi:BON domain
MPRQPGQNPKSYEDIVRQTVVDPDTSSRPTREQVEQAHTGFRALDADEQALHDRVVDALAASGVTGVTPEVSGNLVTLRGRVTDVSRLRTIEDAVAAVPGVTTIHNLVVVGA